MHPAIRRAGLALALAGVDPRAMGRAAANTPRYLRELRAFRELSAVDGSDVRLRDALPALTDRRSEAGNVGEYFLADLWTARRVFHHGPRRHIDVGSRLDGLVAHLLAFVDVDVVDVRPLTSTVDGLQFILGDATEPDGLTGITGTSVSSIHAIEHFGLGRYGDPLDPHGHIKGIKSIACAVETGGHLYLGFPVGVPRVEFNAHRILDPLLPAQILDGFRLEAFAAVADGKVIETDPDAVVGERYVLGLYDFTRQFAEPHSPETRE